MKPAQYWIEKLRLTPTQVGGLFATSGTADDGVRHAALPERFNGDRSLYSTNYYLLRRGEVLLMHALNQDEQWFWHHGGAVRLHVFQPNGARYSTLAVGGNVEQGEQLSGVAPHNTWFGGLLEGDAPYALVSCSLAPGYDARDSKLPAAADITALERQFPEHVALIAQLTTQRDELASA